MDDSLPPVPLEVKVCQRAHEFTLPALLDVLYFLGYRSEDIEFRSHMSQARPASLIHAVEFLRPGHYRRHEGSQSRRKVKVTVNLGLLSAQSPLPSYFIKIAEKLEGEALVDFLGFFDHHLLKRRTMSLYPERDRTVFADWGETQNELLQLLGLCAPSTLHWLCERIYPELGVRVERSTAQKPLKAQGAVLGHAVLGEACAFGGSTTVPVGGIDITLYSEETLSPTGIPWPTEAARRLREQLFSVIGQTELYLTVYLLMLEQESWLQMHDDRFLGYEPTWDPSRGPIPEPLPVLDSPLAPPGNKKPPRLPPAQVAPPKLPPKSPPKLPGTPSHTVADNPD